MGQILQNWRILVSTFLSVALILVAYLLAQSVRSPHLAEASPESALLQAIATKDSDGDGLTDWEEALYGTSPNITDTFNLGMTDGEAVTNGLIVPKAIADIKIATSTPVSYDEYGLPPPPGEGTLTDAFAKNFFTLYLSAKEANGDANLTESEMANIANEALSSLSSAVTTSPDFKSAKDIVIVDSGTEALKEYAAKAEAVLMTNSSNATTSEINYLKSAVENNDVTAISHIVSIAKGYRDSAAGLAILTVPREVAYAHLLLVNSVMRFSQVTTDFARVNEDPLATILALQQYAESLLSIRNAFINIDKIYKTAGITLSADTPGAQFINLIDDTSGEQRTVKEKL